MSPPPAAAERRLLVLCGIIPLAEMSQDEVDYLFRRAVEDAQPEEPRETVAEPVVSKPAA